MTLPPFEFRSISSSGILDAVTLRRFLVDENAPTNSHPTASDCEWIIGILERAHEGSFPRPRHHGFGAQQLEEAGLPPPSAFDVSFHHFDLGIGFPWSFWVWFAVWLTLVWAGKRKWLAARNEPSL